MKILTKPVKPRLSSPHIYGYEGDPGKWKIDGTSIVEYGDPVETTWYYTYLACEAADQHFCNEGESDTKVRRVDH